MTHPRLRRAGTYVAGPLAGLAIAAVGFVPSSPAQAKPSIDDVQSKVDSLYQQAEQASEDYNHVKIELKQLRQDVGSLKSDEHRQNASLDQVRADVRSSVVQQSTGGDLTGLNSLISSGDTSSLLSQMSTLSSYNTIQQGKLSDYQTGLKALDIRHDATLSRVEQVAALKAQLASAKQTIDAKYSDAKDLLGRLQEQQRQELLTRGTVSAPTDIPASGRAAAAVHYAMAQVGKAYVYGAAGPSAFDCSGLTMMAWAQAGVALPHSSQAQFAMFPHIPESQLQPGDLVFYYSGISHVGMYIGNGLIVNAENPSVGVKVTTLHSMPYMGAVRPG